MPNDVKLQEGHPVDENLRPIKVGGKSTALEVAQNGNGARVTGDLEVTGDTYASIDKMYSGLVPAYAGMILGATEIYTGVAVSYQSVTSSYVNINIVGAAYLNVTFVVPPSNKVKLTVHIAQVQRATGDLQLGLATDTSATTLDTRYQRKVWDVDETDHVGIFYEWYVDGSDVSWSAGESKTIYAMVRADSNVGRLMYGISGTDNYNSWTMEAIALPAAVGDGS